jgi:phenylalanyl-tRNA synthetase beta chain
MRVGLKWLEDYVRVDVPVGKLVELLNLSGTKVEAVHEPGRSLDGIVVAEVLAIEEHPNADNLTLVDVRVDGDTERVVCGARNFGVGDKVPYARVGAKLPGLEIAERKIRGEVSRGMLCSAAELGISKDHSGILVLPADAAEGQDVVSLLGLDDTVLELEITPNRPDCMGMIGIAREVAALLGNELRIPEVALPTGDSGAPRVKLADPAGCPRYVAYLIEGVQVGPSPSWMATRLLGAGLRSISNVVDATNYVLLETGHPLHAFDADRVHERSIVVRRARRGEKLTTLDGVERALTTGDLLIADPKEALALAGIMGGDRSEVSATTTSVILEAAYFDPSTIGRTSRRLDLLTEASTRFERGTDPDGLTFAAARCAGFISEAPPTGVVDEYPAVVEHRTVTLRPERTSALLGFEVSTNEQVKHLRSVGLSVAEREEALDVEVPGYRPDIHQEVDLIEEVARLAGFERLPSSLPKGGAGGLEPLQASERALRRALVGMGITEAWTPSLGSAGELADLGLADAHPGRKMVAIANPMSEQADKLRTTLLPGLLRAVAHNVAHRMDDVALFEIARIFEPSSRRLPDEPLILGAAFCGDRSSKAWDRDAVRWGFFEAKGALEAACASLGVEIATTPSEGAPYHPTRAALVHVGDTTAGSLGELHPTVCASFDVPEGTVVFEVALAPVFDALPERVKVSDVPRFPPITLDLAIVVDDSVAASDVRATIESAGGDELASVELFDLYRGEQVPDGKKSLAYALEMRAPDRTLTDADAVAVKERIVAALRATFEADLRS